MMKKYLLLFTILFSVSIFAQTPTPAKSYTKFLKLKQYRSGAMNVADSLNWNYDQIDTTLRFINNGLNISLDSVKHYYTYIDSAFTEIHQTEDTLQFQAGQIITLNQNMGNLNGTVVGLESTVTLLDTAINLESVERVNADTVLSGRIQVQADNIELRVKKDDVISSINLTPEAAKIKANRIELNGYTVIKNINGSNDSTTIDAGKIKTTDITALGNVTAGSFNLGNGKFQVSSSGDLTASSAALSGSFNSDGTNGSINIQDGVITGSYPFSEVVMGNGGLTLSYGGYEMALHAWDGPTSIGDGFLSISTSGGGVEIDGSKALTSSNSTIGDITGLQSALDGKASASHSHATGGEGAPTGNPGNNMTYYDATNNKYYINFGGSWVEIHP